MPITPIMALKRCMATFAQRMRWIEVPTNVSYAYYSLCATASIVTYLVCFKCKYVITFLYWLQRKCNRIVFIVWQVNQAVRGIKEESLSLAVGTVINANEEFKIVAECAGVEAVAECAGVEAVAECAGVEAVAECAGVEAVAECAGVEASAEEVYVISLGVKSLYQMVQEKLADSKGNEDPFCVLETKEKNCHVPWEKGNFLDKDKIYDVQAYKDKLLDVIASKEKFLNFSTNTENLINAVPEEVKPVDILAEREIFVDSAVKEEKSEHSAVEEENGIRDQHQTFCDTNFPNQHDKDHTSEKLSYISSISTSLNERLETDKSGFSKLDTKILKDIDLFIEEIDCNILKKETKTLQDIKILVEHAKYKRKSEIVKDYTCNTSECKINKQTENIAEDIETNFESIKCEPYESAKYSENTSAVIPQKFETHKIGNQSSPTSDSPKHTENVVNEIDLRFIYGCEMLCYK